MDLPTAAPEPVCAPPKALTAVRVALWAAPDDTLHRLVGSLSGVDMVGRATALAGATRLLADQPDVLIVATAEVVDDAAAIVERFDVARPPLLILVGERASEALAAFDMRAFDFLRRPATRRQLETAFDRARQWREQDRVVRLLNGAAIMLSKVPAPAALARHMMPLIVNGRVMLVDTAEIELIEAAGNYVTVVTPYREYQHRATMNRCVVALRSHGFVRAHRRFLVNSRHVMALGPDRTVTLRSRRIIPCGRRYYPGLATLVAS